MKRNDFNFDLKQIQSFLEVLKQGSFTRASRKLKVGQATISHHIGQLEKTLGVKLLNRAAREISITDQGKAFRAFCEALFKNIEILAADIAGETAEGTAVIASSTIPAAYILPEHIFEMRNICPGVIFRLEVTDSREAVEMVKEGRVDIGIVGKEYKHRSLAYVPVCDDEIVLAGPIAFPDRVSPADLKTMPLITREPGSGTRKTSEEALALHGIMPSALNVVMECSSSEGIRESIAAGIGASFISRRALTSAVKMKRLKIIDVKGFGIHRSFLAVHSPGRTLPRSVQILLDLLKKRQI
ncbi:MAG: LysR family transcriptional regulator [Chrysiogenales bacterium]|nr:MAG: LysR family transcriptional regulator [Chrysiogenales bacterium]